MTRPKAPGKADQGLPSASPATCAAMETAASARPIAPRAYDSQFAT
jgi:hypothetical protein